MLDSEAREYAKQLHAAGDEIHAALQRLGIAPNARDSLAHWAALLDGASYWLENYSTNRESGELATRALIGTFGLQAADLPGEPCSVCGTDPTLLDATAAALAD